MLFPLQTIYETHVRVRDRAASVAFYRDVLGLPMALSLDERDVTFLWLGDKANGMLGIWGAGSPNAPISGRAHFAYTVPLDVLRKAPQTLREKGVQPLGLTGAPIEEPVVIGWMPAAAVYFADPDGHVLELIHILEDEPKPELGVVSLSQWLEAHAMS